MNNVQDDGLTIEQLSWGKNLGNFVGKGFDIIMGSDIMYSPPSFSSILQYSLFYRYSAISVSLVWETVDALLNNSKYGNYAFITYWYLFVVVMLFLFSLM